MPNREKVIKDLEKLCKKSNCPFVCFDALALLKEQEAVEPIRDKKTGRCWLCGKCGAFVGFEDNDPTENNSFNNYCSNCGNPVLWEGR